MDELYKELRNQLVAFKVTDSEKLELEKYCKDKGFSVSRFVRHAVKVQMSRKD